MSNSPPIHKLKLRGVEVAIWSKHDEEKGTRYSLTARKSYWDKTREEYVETSSFFPEEAAVLSILLQHAVSWVAEQKTPAAREENGGGKVWKGEDQKAAF